MNTRPPYRDRADAGRRLAASLTAYAGLPNVIVLALPRGGVPVAREIARALRCPMDLLTVRKLGTPGQEELAMGAIATGGVRLLNPAAVAQCGASPEEIEAVAVRERHELERREKVYRGGRGALDVRDRIVILVDDGLATGTTMRAAIQAARALGAKRVVAAAPVGSLDTCRSLRREADDLVCPVQARDLFAISVWYEDFRQTSDAEVQRCMAAAAEPGV